MQEYTKQSIGDIEKYPKDADFKFNYGIIEVTDFKAKTITTYTLCIRLGLVEKVCGQKPYTEVQFIYRDNDFKTQCALLNRSTENYSIKVLEKGDMQISL